MGDTCIRCGKDVTPDGTGGFIFGADGVPGAVCKECCARISSTTGSLIFNQTLSFGGLGVRLLKELAENPKTEVLYDEVDEDIDDVFIHRVLHWIGHENAGGPYREIEIRFRDLEIRQKPRPDRKIERTGIRYQTLGVDPI